MAMILEAINELFRKNSVIKKAEGDFFATFHFNLVEKERREEYGGKELVTRTFSFEEGENGEEYTLLCCGNCGTPKENLVFFLGKVQRVAMLCKCGELRREEEEKMVRQREWEMKFRLLKQKGISDERYLAYTFQSMDMRNKAEVDFAKKYVEKWREMKKIGSGILFFGQRGTGKTYLACAIANALMERLVSVYIGNFTTILSELQSFSPDSQKLVSGLKGYDVVVLDDLGVERNTPFALEQVYHIVDTLVRGGVICILTTNLTLNQLEQPQTLEYARIYDRVLELCPIRVPLLGESRRIDVARQREEQAMGVLFSGS